MYELSCAQFSTQAKPIDFSNLMQPEYAQCLIEQDDWVMKAFVFGQGGYAERLGSWFAEAWKPHCAEVGQRIRNDILGSESGKISYLKDSESFKDSPLPLLHYLLNHGEYLLLSEALKYSDTDLEEWYEGVKFIVRAACDENEEVFYQLLESNARLGLVDGKGNSIFHYLAAEGSWSKIQAVLSKEPYLLLKENHAGYTGLDYLFHHGGLEIQSRLFEYLTTLNKPELIKAFQEKLLIYIWDSLHEAVEARGMQAKEFPYRYNNAFLSGVFDFVESIGEGVGLLTEKNLAEKAGVNFKGENALQVALRHDFKGIVSIYLPFLSDLINHKDNNDETLLHSAVRDNDYKLVESLISMGANPYSSTSTGVTPVHHAIANRSPECNCVLKSLSQYDKWDWEKRFVNNNRFLHLVAESGREDILPDIPDNIFLESVKHVNSYGETPLSLAVKNQQWDCFADIIKRIKGENKNILDDLLYDAKNPLIAKLPYSLSSHEKAGSIIEELWGECFRKVAETINKSNQPLSLEHMWQWRFSDGNNLLLAVSQFGKWDLVDSLVRAGLDESVLRHQNDEGRNILMISSVHNQHKIANEIIKKVPHLMFDSDHAGYNPFHYAVYVGHDLVWKRFIKDGKAFGEFTNAGESMLSISITALSETHKAKERVETYKHFIGETRGRYQELYQDFISHKNTDGQIPLRKAIKAGNLEIAKHTFLLFSKEAVLPKDTEYKLPSDVKVFLSKDRDSQGNLLLHDAAEFPEIYQWLSNHLGGLPENQLSLTGETPAHFAAKHGQVKTVSSMPDGKGVTPWYQLLSFNNETPLFNAVKYKRLNFIKAFHKAGGDINHKNLDGVPAIVLSLISGVDVFNALIELGATLDFIEPATNKTTLHIATQHQRVDVINAYPAALRKMQSNVKDSNGNVPLFYAAKSGNEEVISRLMVETENPYALLNNNNETLVHCFAEGGCDKRIKAHIDEHGSESLLHEDKDKFNILHKAALHGHCALLTYAISQLGDIHEHLKRKTKTGETVLSLLAMTSEEIQSPILISEVLNKGAEIEAVNDNGQNALHVSVIKGQKEAFRALLSHASKEVIESKDKFGKTVLHYIAEGGFGDLLKELPKASVLSMLDVKDDEGNTPLLLALGGFRDLLNELKKVSMLPMLGVKDNEDNIRLQLASSRGHLELAKTIFNLGASVTTINKKKLSPLHLAFQFFDIDEVDTWVVKAREEQLWCLDNMKTENGLTPMHFAIQGGRKDTLASWYYLNKLLKGTCAHFFIRSWIQEQEGNKHPPILPSAFSSDKKVFDYLLKKGADIYAINKEKENILHMACRSGSQAVLSELLANPDIDFKRLHVADRKGRTPLAQALQSGQIGAVARLIPYLSAHDLTISDKQEMTPLHYAASFCSPTVLQLIYSALPEEQRFSALTARAGKTGDTPLSLASRAGCSESLVWLLERGVDINEITNYYESPLTIGAEAGHAQLIQFLINYAKQNPELSLDLDKSDAYWHSAKQYAELNGHHYILQLLENEGAKDPDVAHRIMSWLNGKTTNSYLKNHYALTSHGKQSYSYQIGQVILPALPSLIALGLFGPAGALYVLKQQLYSHLIYSPLLSCAEDYSRRHLPWFASDALHLTSQIYLPANNFWKSPAKLATAIGYGLSEVSPYAMYAVTDTPEKYPELMGLSMAISRQLPMIGVEIRKRRNNGEGEFWEFLAKDLSEGKKKFNKYIDEKLYKDFRGTVKKDGYKALDWVVEGQLSKYFPRDKKNSPNEDVSTLEKIKQEQNRKYLRQIIQKYNLDQPQKSQGNRLETTLLSKGSQSMKAKDSRKGSSFSPNSIARETFKYIWDASSQLAKVPGNAIRLFINDVRWFYREVPVAVRLTGKRILALPSHIYYELKARDKETRLIEKIMDIIFYRPEFQDLSQEQIDKLSIAIECDRIRTLYLLDDEGEYNKIVSQFEDYRSYHGDMPEIFKKIYRLPNSERENAINEIVMSKVTALDEVMETVEPRLKEIRQMGFDEFRTITNEDAPEFQRHIIDNINKENIKHLGKSIALLKFEYKKVTDDSSERIPFATKMPDEFDGEDLSQYKPSDELFGKLKVKYVDAKEKIDKRIEELTAIDVELRNEAIEFNQKTYNKKYGDKIPDYLYDEGEKLLQTFYKENAHYESANELLLKYGSHCKDMSVEQLSSFLNGILVAEHQMKTDNLREFEPIMNERKNMISMLLLLNRYQWKVPNKEIWDKDLPQIRSQIEQQPEDGGKEQLRRDYQSKFIRESLVAGLSRIDREILESGDCLPGLPPFKLEDNIKTTITEIKSYEERASQLTRYFFEHLYSAEVREQYKEQFKSLEEAVYLKFLQSQAGGEGDSISQSERLMNNLFNAYRDAMSLTGEHAGISDLADRRLPVVEVPSTNRPSFWKQIEKSLIDGLSAGLSVGVIWEIGGAITFGPIFCGVMIGGITFAGSQHEQNRKFKKETQSHMGGSWGASSSYSGNHDSLLPNMGESIDFTNPSLNPGFNDGFVKDGETYFSILGQPGLSRIPPGYDGSYQNLNAFKPFNLEFETQFDKNMREFLAKSSFAQNIYGIKPNGGASDVLSMFFDAQLKKSKNPFVRDAAIRRQNEKMDDFRKILNNHYNGLSTDTPIFHVGSNPYLQDSIFSNMRHGLFGGNAQAKRAMSTKFDPVKHFARGAVNLADDGLAIGKGFFFGVGDFLDKSSSYVRDVALSTHEVGKNIVLYPVRKFKSILLKEEGATDPIGQKYFDNAYDYVKSEVRLKRSGSPTQTEVLANKGVQFANSAFNDAFEDLAKYYNGDESRFGKHLSDWQDKSLEEKSRFITSTGLEIMPSGALLKGAKKGISALKSMSIRCESLPKSGIRLRPGEISSISGYKGGKTLKNSDFFDFRAELGRASAAELKMLTPAQRATVKRIDNAIEKHALPLDFIGVEKEVSGIKIPKPDGGFYDHVQEMRNTIKHIDKQMISIENSLKNPNLQKGVKKVLTDAHNRGQKTISKMTNSATIDLVEDIKIQAKKRGVTL